MPGPISRVLFDIRVAQVSGRIKVSPSKVKLNLTRILKKLGWKQAAISVLLVSDRRIQTFNRIYLRHDRPTDVITFGQNGGKGINPKLGEYPFLGDIMISVDTTARQAREYKNSFWYELNFYLCHGILHLMGWKDRTETDRKRMFKKQEKILKSIGVRNFGNH